MPILTTRGSGSDKGFGKLSGGGAPLYEFTTHTFTNAGVVGRFGPTLAQCQSAYSGQIWLPLYFGMVIQGIQEWTVPVSATYRITTVGARGGKAGTASGVGGYGAYIQGDFSLEGEQVLRIVVGQGGSNTGQQARVSTGGGGASAVWLKAADSEPLSVAGGGGGMTDFDEGHIGRQSNIDAWINNQGKRGSSDAFPNTSGRPGAEGGTNGSGGFVAYSGSPDTTPGAGAGFKSDGENEGGDGTGTPWGRAIRTSAIGGLGNSNSSANNNGGTGIERAGGFGGGGSGGGWYGCSGGGGGYGGGGAGSDGDRTCGGGGGSYNAGSNQTNYNAWNTDYMGYVTITKIG